MKPEELHPTTRDVWITVARLIHETHLPPSYRDIQRELGISYPSVVKKHLDILVELGYLEHKYQRHVDTFAFVWPPIEYLDLESA